MSVRDFYIFNRNQLQTKIKSETEQVAAGRAKDFPEYKRMCGRITAMQDCLKQLQDNMRKYHAGEIDDDE